MKYGDFSMKKAYTFYVSVVADPVDFPNGTRTTVKKFRDVSLLDIWKNCNVFLAKHICEKVHKYFWNGA